MGYGMKGKSKEQLLQQMLEQFMGMGIEKGGSNGKSKAPKGVGKGGKSAGKIAQYDSSQKVWIGKVAEGVTNEDVKAWFTEMGLVPEMVSCKAGGSGVVVFGSADDATTAIGLTGQELAGQAIEVDVWTGK